MKLSRIAAPLALAAALCSGAVHAQQSPTPTAGRALDVLEDGVVLKTQVVSVDPARRVMVVEGAGGPVAVRVGDKISGLDKVKAGDGVIVRYAEIFDIGIKKGDGIAESISGAGQAFNKPGQLPAATNLRYVDNTFVVQAVDVKNRTIRVLAPNAKQATLKVGPNVKNLDKLKAGDDIVVNFAEADSVQTVR
jgi:hypothetical protein